MAKLRKGGKRRSSKRGGSNEEEELEDLDTRGSMQKGGKTRKSKKKSHKKTKRKMNAFMTMMLDAKKHKKPSFVYKGKKYKQAKTKTGLVIYKKG